MRKKTGAKTAPIPVVSQDGKTPQVRPGLDAFDVGDMLDQISHRLGGIESLLQDKMQDVTWLDPFVAVIRSFAYEIETTAQVVRAGVIPSLVVGLELNPDDLDKFYIGPGSLVRRRKPVARPRLDAIANGRRAVR